MTFWCFMLLCDAIIPLLMIVGGWFMWKKCPQKINSFIGYRTTRSMKNEEIWIFANHKCGKLWWKTGWCMLPTALVLLLFLHSQEATVAAIALLLCTAQLVTLFLTLYSIEHSLHTNF